MIQVDEGEVCRLVEFTWRKLKGAETRYTETEKDCLAIVHALRKWRHDLRRGPASTVLSEHEALMCLMSLMEPRGRLVKWTCKIKDYNFLVEYAPGESMSVADRLSRDAVEEPRCQKCNERALLHTEGTRSLPSVAEITAGQLDEFGVLETYDEDSQKFALEEHGMLCSATGERLRVVIPRLIAEQVLEFSHWV